MNRNIRSPIRVIVRQSSVGCVFILSVSIVALCAGCGREEDSSGDLDRAAGRAIETIELWMDRDEDDGGAIPKSVTVAREKLNEYGKDWVRETPHLLRAVRTYHKTSGIPLLVLYWLERDSDISAIRVREFWANGKSVDEIYDLPDEQRRAFRRLGKQDPLLYAIGVGVRERTASSMTSADSGMLKLTPNDTMPAGEEDISGMPGVLLGTPSDKTYILVSVIDARGHESQAVKLTHVQPEDKVLPSE